MRVLRADDRPPQPWKNGGGVTREVAAWPEGAGFDDFLWRVSLAEVDTDGPFSVFPGVDRILAVLNGRLLLRVSGRSDLAVAVAGPPAEFPGDAPTFGALLDGPVHDLNLMARRGVVRARLERLMVKGAHALAASSAQRIVIPTDGKIRAGVHTVERLDALQLDPTDPGVTLRADAPTTVYVASFEAA